MSRLEFLGSTRVVIAPGEAAAALGDELAAAPGQRWGVVADRGLADSGGLDGLLAQVAGGPPPVIGLVDEDPSTEDVAALLAAARAHAVDAVVAIGGGSGLCAGKAVAIGLTNSSPLTGYVGLDRLSSLPAPCVAIPTTGGSGSEVSEVVILHQRDGGPHLMIRGHGYAPRVAILDGRVLATLPARPLLLAALDAFSHAYEALWSRGANAFTDAFALAAAVQIRESVPAALTGDPQARQQLIEASAMANYACGNSGLATAHALTSAPDVHLPHGYQTGVLLPWVAERITDRLRPQAAAEIACLDGFYAEIGFTPRFAPGELDEASLEAMVAAGLENPLSQNDPRPPTADDLRALLRRAGAGDPPAAVAASPESHERKAG